MTAILGCPSIDVSVAAASRLSERVLAYDRFMARPNKRRIEGSDGSTGRTTPKGGGHSQPEASSRYTPPADQSQYMPSPTWVPVLMFTFFGVGTLMIFLNYTETLPGAASGWYLLGGLGSILAGIITATQLR